MSFCSDSDECCIVNYMEHSFHYLTHSYIKACIVKTLWQDESKLIVSREDFSRHVFWYICFQSVCFSSVLLKVVHYKNNCCNASSKKKKKKLYKRIDHTRQQIIYYHISNIDLKPKYILRKYILYNIVFYIII